MKNGQEKGKKLLFLYSWTMKKAEHQRTDAFEL